jgi:RimJ/RimL family protein N-acetyltransferase
VVKVLGRRRGVEPAVVGVDEFFRLDQWLPDDAAAHRHFALDPDAARFLGWTVEQAASAPDSHYDEVIARFAREWREGTRFSFAIRRCSDGVAVGSVELRPSGSEADVSYMLAPELRGQGLASRALAALIAWGTRELGLRRINLGCHVDDAASQRVAERCGFNFVCRDGDELRFHRDTMPACGRRLKTRPPAPVEN